MSRVKMVTRTVTQTTAEVMSLDVTTAEVHVNSFTIGGVFSNDELLKSLKNIYETEEFKLVHIVSQSTEELLLGMTEVDFIRVAKVLSPRNTNKSVLEDSEN